MEAAFAKAHAVAEISIVNPRIVTNYMETRGVICSISAVAVVASLLSTTP